MMEVERSTGKSVRRERWELEGILNKFNEGSALIWVVFALSTTAAVFNSLHSNVYVFIAEDPVHWCTVSELSQANWTDSEIRNVSSATSCTRYSYNYSYLATLSFEEALAFAENHTDVATEKRTNFSYAEGTEATSIAIKWDLVCERTALRSSVQMSVALGNFVGAPLFGLIADRIIMNNFHGPHIFEVVGKLKSTARFAESDEDSSEKLQSADDARVVEIRYLKKFNNSIAVCSNSESRNRQFIVGFEWIISSLTYFGIALSGNNFSADQYIYSFLTGLTEVPGLLLLLPLLVVLGRRPAAALLFLIAGISLMCILMIPRSETLAIMVVALIGRSAVTAIMSLLLVQVSELFPTVVRNTALGNGTAMVYVGGILSPNIVDLLGEVAWWAPSTLCGAAALMAGALALLLPETRRRPLTATVSEEMMNERGRISIRNCCAF